MRKSEEFKVGQFWRNRDGVVRINHVDGYDLQYEYVSNLPKKAVTIGNIFERKFYDTYLISWTILTEAEKAELL